MINDDAIKTVIILKHGDMARAWLKLRFGFTDIEFTEDEERVLGDWMNEDTESND